MQSFVTDTDMFKHKGVISFMNNQNTYLLHFMYTETKESSYKSPGK